MFELSPFDRRHRNSVFNPFQEFENLSRNFFGDSFFSEFRTDIKDIGNAYLLEADLPGFNKDEIKIDINENYLTINAERSSESEEKDDKGRFIRRERSYGSFSRSFDVSNVNIDNIKAEYNNGVLKLNLPKKEGRNPTSRRLEIE
jgi:HSP20 family protein